MSQQGNNNQAKLNRGELSSIKIKKNSPFDYFRDHLVLVSKGVNFADSLIGVFQSLSNIINLLPQPLPVMIRLCSMGLNIVFNAIGIIADRKTSWKEKGKALAILGTFTTIGIGAIALILAFPQIPLLTYSIILAFCTVDFIGKAYGLINIGFTYRAKKNELAEAEKELNQLKCENTKIYSNSSLAEINKYISDINVKLQKTTDRDELDNLTKQKASLIKIHQIKKGLAEIKQITTTREAIGLFGAIASTTGASLLVITAPIISLAVHALFLGSAITSAIYGGIHLIKTIREKPKVSRKINGSTKYTLGKLIENAQCTYTLGSKQINTPTVTSEGKSIPSIDKKDALPSLLTTGLLAKHKIEAICQNDNISTNSEVVSSQARDTNPIYFSSQGYT